MSLPVYLAQVAGVAVGASVTVAGDEARHAVVVRRTRVGEQVVLADGAGTAATGEVTATSKSSFVVEVREVLVSDRPEPRVTAVQAIPKGERAELAVEVLTEVGADRIVPWAAERCVGVWRGERAVKSLARWRSTAREAGKQSRRAWQPEVADLATTDQVAALLREADLAVVLHEAAEEALADLAVPTTGSVVVVVGPEGGLTDEEVAVLADAGGHVVRLGESVLRTSTAGVVAVGALLARTPRWGATGR